MRNWKTRSRDIIASATLVSYGVGKVQLRQDHSVDIAVRTEELSEYDAEYVVRVTGMSLKEIRLAPENSTEGILRSPIVLDDLYHALYYQWCRNARTSVTRYHLETLLSPVLLKVLIRIQFTRPRRSQNLHYILRGIAIVGRCLQSRYYRPRDGGIPVLWTLRRLWQACYKRRLFHLPEACDNVAGAQPYGWDVEQKVTEQTKWLYWVVCANNMWDKFEDLTSYEATEWAARNVDMPVHDLFKQLPRRDSDSRVLTRAEGPSFPSRDINIKTLKELGGIQLHWTDNYADHLKLSSTSQGKTLSIFWDRTSYGLSNLVHYQYNNVPFTDGSLTDHTGIDSTSLKPMSFLEHTH